MKDHVQPVDRSQFQSPLNQALTVDPGRTAVITIDCHRGHLDLAVVDLKMIVVADDAHTMFGDDLHWSGLQNIARCLGWVVSLDDLMEKVTANAG
jgi:isochorismate hydrolase